MKGWIIWKALSAALVVAMLGTAAPTAGAVGVLSPTSHDFGEQAVGTTGAPHPFILSNFCTVQDPADPFFCGGFNPVSPAVSTTGDFAQTNDCPATLIPITFSIPGSCTISVTFAPTTAGPRTGTLTAASGVTSSLSGTGVESQTPPPGDGTTPPPDGSGSPAPDDANEFSFGKVKRNKRKGTAKLTVNVPGAGELELAKTKKVKPDDESADDAGREKLAIKPKGKAKKKLNTKGKAKVKANVTYTPTGGTPNTEDKKIKLVKR